MSTSHIQGRHIRQTCKADTHLLGGDGLLVDVAHTRQTHKADM